MKVTKRPLILLQAGRPAEIPWDIANYDGMRDKENAPPPIFLFQVGANAYQQCVLHQEDAIIQVIDSQAYWKVLKTLIKEQQAYYRYHHVSYNAKKLMIDLLHLLVLSGTKIAIEWMVVPPTAKPNDITLGENVVTAGIVGAIAVLFSILPRNWKHLRQGPPIHRPLLLPPEGEARFQPPLSTSGWLWRWMLLFFLVSTMVFLSQKLVRYVWLGNIEGEDQAVLDNAQILSSAFAGVTGVWHHHTFFSSEEGCLVRGIKQASKGIQHLAEKTSGCCSGWFSRQGSERDDESLIGENNERKPQRINQNIRNIV